jgi:hypothetical protein
MIGNTGRQFVSATNTGNKCSCICLFSREFLFSLSFMTCSWKPLIARRPLKSGTRVQVQAIPREVYGRQNSTRRVSLRVLRLSPSHSHSIHCTTSVKVAGPIPEGANRIFHWHNPSGCTMALELNQLLTEMSTRNISWGKGGRCVVLTTLPPSCADCLEILGASTFWNPHGLFRPVMGQFLLPYNHFFIHTFSNSDTISS